MKAGEGTRKDGLIFNRQTRTVIRLILFQSYDELMKYQLSRTPEY